MSRSFLAVLMSIILVAAGCATGAGDAGTPDQQSITTTSSSDAGTRQAPESSGDPQSSPGMPDATTDTRPLPEGEPALDFSLAIGADQTEQFILSEEVKPVFMVFWAEW